MEFIQRPSWSSLGEEAQLFSHMTYNHYSAPTGFNFESVNTANKGNDFFEVD
jgi:hypothetical protein